MDQQAVWRKLFVAVALMILFPLMHGESNSMQNQDPELPGIIKQWRLEGNPRRIIADNIFDYMNGAGELYLGYHFDFLLVYDYREPEGNDIVVELYHMKHSDDAFGLLSMDWGGEVQNFFSPAGYPHALYGKGLLRMWSENLYARIMAVRETRESKSVILQLGRTITSGRSQSLPPKLTELLKPEADSGWVLRKDHIGYFYSHLVLNSLYYLSHENILDLGHSAEAVHALYERTRNDQKTDRTHLLVIKYPGYRQAEKALKGFNAVYLKKWKKSGRSEQTREREGIFQLEDGWMGYRIRNRYLVLLFGCPDPGSVGEIINSVYVNNEIEED